MYSLPSKRFRGVFCTKRPISVFLDAREIGLLALTPLKRLLRWLVNVQIATVIWDYFYICLQNIWPRNNIVLEFRRFEQRPPVVSRTVNFVMHFGYWIAICSLYKVIRSLSKKGQNVWSEPELEMLQAFQSYWDTRAKDWDGYGRTCLQ